jgi:hypothetical protein
MPTVAIDGGGPHGAATAFVPAWRWLLVLGTVEACSEELEPVGAERVAVADGFGWRAVPGAALLRVSSCLSVGERVGGAAASDTAGVGPDVDPALPRL